MEWARHAACRGRTDEWTLTQDNRGSRIALAVCQQECPVLGHCRDYAAGQVWAGVVVAGWKAHHHTLGSPPWAKNGA
jgi:Transcription factor WhiB